MHIHKRNLEITLYNGTETQWLSEHVNSFMKLEHFYFKSEILSFEAADDKLSLSFCRSSKS